MKTYILQPQKIEHMDYYREFKEFYFIQAGNTFNKDWIMLNNQSKVEIFCNRILIRNNIKSWGHVRIHWNMGTRKEILIGYLKTMELYGMT